MIEKIKAALQEQDNTFSLIGDAFDLVQDQIDDLKQRVAALEAERKSEA